MVTRTRVALLSVLGVSVASLVILGLRASGQAAPAQPECLLASVAAQPVAGGNLYTYVLDPAAGVVMVFENGRAMAGYQVGEAGAGGPYALQAERAEPAGGGQVYCFVVDHGRRAVHVLEGMQYLGVQSLLEPPQA